MLVVARVIDVGVGVGGVLGKDMGTIGQRVGVGKVLGVGVGGTILV